MSPAPLVASVVHLTDTGHVLAAVSTGSHEPDLEELTGGSHLRIRFPGTHGHVDVPESLLSVTRLSVTADVLDRPLTYALGSGSAPLVHNTGPGTWVAPTSEVPGVVVWWVGDKAVAATMALSAPDPPARPGATHRLAAYPGSVLFLDEL